MERYWISKKATGYRWFPLWLVLGVGLAIVLLVNSVWNYVSISHRIVVDQVRKDLWLQAAGIDRTMQRGGFRDARLGRRICAGRRRALEADDRRAQAHARAAEGVDRTAGARSDAR